MTKNMATTKQQPQDILAKEEVRKSRTEEFYENYKKTIWTVLGAIVVIGLAVLGYSKFIYAPKAAEAQAKMFPAEKSFAEGNYELALNGDGDTYGFVQVIDEFGGKAGKSVYLYAGISALQLGNFDDAIGYLDKYSGREPILAARALSCKGDAFVGLEKYEEAAKAFDKAAAKADNIFAATYLFKAGLAFEKIGDKASALARYNTIKEKYPESIEGYDIDRYISAVK